MSIAAEKIFGKYYLQFAGSQGNIRQTFLEVYLMKSVYEAMRDYLQTHPYDVGDPDCENILDLLYRAYAETHESDPPEIRQGFIELEELLKTLPLDDNNVVFNLTCRLCTAYEQKAFLDGLQFGAELMLRLTDE